MSRRILAGTTDVSVVIRIIDSTDGTPETGVVFNTSGIDLEYRRELAASVDITEATLAALTTAHADGGFLHIGNGYYRLDLPDAACAAGATGVLVHGTVTGMVVIGEYIELVAYNPYDGVRLGLTALPNAAADAAGGLPISDAGGLALDTQLAATNEVTAARMGALTDWINGGRLDLILDIIAADVVNLDGAAMRGTDSAALASVCTEARLAELAAANLPADIDAILTDTGTTLDGRIPAALVSGRMDASVGAMAAAVVTAAAIADGAIDRATLAADTGLQTIRSNTAQAGAAGTITLDASASAVDDFYNDTLVYLTGGTGAGQVRRIRDYVGSTKVATIIPNWTTTPDATTTFAILPLASVWDETLADHLDAGSTGNALNAAGAAGDPWSTALPGAYGAGTAGNIVGNNLNAPVATIDTVVDAILVDTAEIGAAGAGLTALATQASINVIDDFLDTEIAAIITTLGTPAGVSISADIAAIEAQTDDIGAAGAGLTAQPWNAAWDAEVQSEVDDALVAQRLDELVNADSDIDGAAPPTVGSVIHELMTKTAGSFTYDQSTDSLEAIRDKETDIETDTNELQTDWVNGGRLDLILDIIAADVVNLDGAAMRGTDSAALASVCTEARLAELAAANLPADTDTLLSRLSAARALLLDEITAARMGALTDWINGGRLDLILDIIAADTTTDIPALIAALNDLSAAQVNAEVVDALNVDTYTEIGQEAPAATQTLRKMVAYLYKSWRNRKTQTATTRSLYADDGTTVDQKATDSDDGTTFVKGEMGTGP